MKVTIISKLLFGVFLLILFLLGLDRFINRVEENRCAMTFMFEYPQYIKFDVGKETEAEYPHYNLYLYGEGERAVNYHKGQFSGIPVLFIPGNAGSHKQVRSIASVAYRKSLDSRKQFHFDFYSLDLNEELSALYGGILERQVSFAQLCIKKILQIYRTRNQNSVILIAHSMGGMVAKGILIDQTFDSAQVKTIITLATPHKHPVLTLDRGMAAFYQKVNHFWSKTSNETANVAMVSVGGANRDIQVRSGLTQTNRAVNTLTTGIPGVWISVDHLCIAWCKQLISTVVRSLFDMVDSSTLKMTDRVEQRNKVLSYHFLKRYAGKHFVGAKYPDMVRFDPEGKWREVIVKRLKISLDEETNVNTYYMIPLVDNAYRNRLIAIATNFNVKYWVFACVASSWHNSVRYCEEGVNLSDQTTQLPHTTDNSKRKLIDVDLVQLRQQHGFTHLIFNIPKNHFKGSIEFDVHRSADRNVAVNVPWKSYFPLTVINSVSIPADALSYNITLPDLTRAWQSLVLTAEGSDCQTDGTALFRKTIPWSPENQFYLANQSISLQLHAPKALVHSEDMSAGLQFLNLNQCNYEIRIANDWIGMWSQLVRFYWPAILSLVSAIFLYCFSQQLRALGRKTPVPSTLSCLVHMSVVKSTLIPEFIALAIGVVDSCHFQWWPFPATDEFFLRQDGLGFPLIYLVFGGTAWTVAVILTSGFSLGLFIAGSAMHSLLIRYLRSNLGISSIIAEIVTLGLSRLPLVVSIVLIAVGISSCGALAIVLGLFFCIWKMFAYYEDQLESLLSQREKHEADDSFRITATISLMWICTAVISLPALIVWAKTPTLALPEDPSLVISFIWSVFGMAVLQKSNYNNSRWSFSYETVANGVLVLSALLSVYGLFSIYRVQYFIACAILLYASKQLL